MAVFDIIRKVRGFEGRAHKPAPSKEYTSIDPGGRPITAPEERIRGHREKYVEPWAEPLGNAFSRAGRRVADVFSPGQPFMNSYRQKQIIKEKQDSSFERKMILRKQNPKEIVVW